MNRARYSPIQEYPRDHAAHQEQEARLRAVANAMRSRHAILRARLRDRASEEQKSSAGDD